MLGSISFLWSASPSTVSIDTMKKNKEVKISYFAAHLTTIVSVTLLLLIVGCIGLLAVAGRNTSREVKQLQQVSVVTADSITDATAQPLFDYISQQPYAIDPKLITQQEALEEWNERTGEDLMEVAGYNFLSPEISFRVQENYTSAQGLQKIKNDLQKRAEVAEVITPESETTQSMDSFLEQAFIVLGFVAIVLIIISCVLINNTVLLTIYARRFTIYTMQLVGATNNFIRRPFILNNILSGILAATLASAILIGALFFVHDTEFTELFTYVDMQGIEFVIIGLYAVGIIVCGFSAMAAATRYLRRNYDELFRK